MSELDDRVEYTNTSLSGEAKRYLEQIKPWRIS